MHIIVRPLGMLFSTLRTLALCLALWDAGCNIARYALCIMFSAYSMSFGSTCLANAHLRARAPLRLPCYTAPGWLSGRESAEVSDSLTCCHSRLQVRTCCRIWQYDVVIVRRVCPHVFLSTRTLRRGSRAGAARRRLINQ